MHIEYACMLTSKFVPDLPELVSDLLETRKRYVNIHVYADVCLFAIKIHVPITTAQELYSGYTTMCK